MPSFARLAFLLSLLALWSYEVEADSAAVTPPGSRMSIVPPEGFELRRKRFQTFEHSATGAIIFFEEDDPRAFPMLREFHKKESMAQQDQDPVIFEDLGGSPCEGVLLESRLELGGQRFHRWILFMSHRWLTGKVTFQVPESAIEEIGRDEIRSSLLSLRTTATNRFNTWPLETIETERLKISNVMGDIRVLDTMEVMYWETANVRRPALFAIVVSPEHELPADLRAYSEKILRSIDGVTIDSIDAQNEVQVDGLQGFEARGRCRDGYEEEACAFFHIAVFEDRRFIRFFGLVGGDDLKDYLGEFRQLVQGTKRKW